MTNELKTALLEAEAGERRSAFRALVATPLVTAAKDADAFRCIVRHRAALTKWFHDNAGWQLRVEVESGFARLLKVAHRDHDDRPLRSRRGLPFERRRYVLLAQTLACLDEQTGQTTLRNVARRVTELALDDGLPPFDPIHFHERRALADVLLWLEDAGVLLPRDGETERYAHDTDGDALYDVNDRLVALMIAAPQSPAIVGEREEISREVYPDTAEGARLSARHHIVRALIDDPVVYYDELPTDARAWLEASRGWLYDNLERQFGFEVERRREGLAAIDPAATATDTLFPDGGSTVKHAALLVAEQMVERHRENAMSTAAVRDMSRSLIADHPTWRAHYRDADQGATDLADEVMALLASFRLVVKDADGWRVRAAIARFRPALVVEKT